MSTLPRPEIRRDVPECGQIHTTKQGWLDQVSGGPIRSLSATALPLTSSIKFSDPKNWAGSLQPEFGYRDADGEFHNLNLNGAS